MHSIWKFSPQYVCSVPDKYEVFLPRDTTTTHPASGSLAATQRPLIAQLAFSNFNRNLCCFGKVGPLTISMLTKATSLPQITLTDFDAEQSSGGEVVLFQEQWKRQKINVVLPVTRDGKA